METSESCFLRSLNGDIPRLHHETGWYRTKALKGPIDNAQFVHLVEVLESQSSFVDWRTLYLTLYRGYDLPFLIAFIPCCATCKDQREQKE